MTPAPPDTELLEATDLLALRCSDYARSIELDPIGSVGCYGGYLLVEWPLPWPFDLSEIPDLAALRPALRANRFRLQGLVAPQDGPLRAIAYRPDPAGGVNFQRAEVTAAREDIAEAALSMFDGDFAPIAAADGDLLVCTHGKRDRCCGSMGTTLALELATRADLGRRLWRTSHTGGHRFAPTAILLPEATAWAYVDAELLTRVISRTGPIEQVIPHYRGYAGLASAELQALEREVLAEMGWDLFDCERSGEKVDDLFQLVVRDASGAMKTFQGEVSSQSLPVPVCGEPISASRKSEPVFTVRAFTQVS